MPDRGSRPSSRPCASASDRTPAAAEGRRRGALGLALLLGLWLGWAVGCGPEPAPPPPVQTWDVRVEGRNHALRLEGRERRVGFTTVRRVRARTAEEAGEAAVELVRTDPIWFGRLPEENAGERSVSALEVTLLDEASAGEAGPSGEYEFFDEFPGGPLR